MFTLLVWEQRVQPKTEKEREKKETEKRDKRQTQKKKTRRKNGDEKKSKERKEILRISLRIGNRKEVGKRKKQR